MFNQFLELHFEIPETKHVTSHQKVAVNASSKDVFVNHFVTGEFILYIIKVKIKLKYFKVYYRLKHPPSALLWQAFCLCCR